MAFEKPTGGAQDRAESKTISQLTTADSDGPSEGGSEANCSRTEGGIVATSSPKGSCDDATQLAQTGEKDNNKSNLQPTLPIQATQDDVGRADDSLSPSTQPATQVATDDDETSLAPTTQGAKTDANEDTKRPKTSTQRQSAATEVAPQVAVKGNSAAVVDANAATGDEEAQLPVKRAAVACSVDDSTTNDESLHHEPDKQKGKTVSSKAKLTSPKGKAVSSKAKITSPKGKQPVMMRKRKAEAESSEKKKLRVFSPHEEDLHDADSCDTDEARPGPVGTDDELPPELLHLHDREKEPRDRDSETKGDRDAVIAAHQSVQNIQPPVPRKGYYSWETFEIALKAYCEANNLRFRIRSSKSIVDFKEKQSDANIPPRFKIHFRNYRCTHGVQQKSRSIGKRSTRSGESTVDGGNYTGIADVPVEGPVADTVAALADNNTNSKGIAWFMSGELGK
ncbi:hypothetical protein PHYBOEH_003918 [Phytophthora boehmeriae]|uniref:Uncharacterized protein n=1 Tax=Phytophthora boehmeriae TaxID=109152 RepID=A0A8T1WPK5_9STRA|nr:hypothetical protein PHYBOEH_003918 [Phytophthora boehmeriae]